MPSISTFYGIIIYMYANDHNPPYLHAHFQDFRAQFDMDGELVNGSLPRKRVRLVSAWIELHRDELLANWELLRNDEMPVKIAPLS